MKRTLLSLMLLVASLASFAYDFEVDGIYYNVLSKDDLTCEVTSRDNNYKSYSGKVTIPSQVSYAGKVINVTSIGKAAFFNCSGLTSVTIPNSVTSIGESAFVGCRGLTSVTIPNSVTSIGEYAFSSCSNVKELIYAEGCETALQTYLTSITSVTIPNSVTSIGPDAFYGCSGLTSVTIPNSVTSIGERAFFNCSSLTSVTIPNSVTSIGKYAFWKCSGLTTVTIGNSVTSIGEEAFRGCSGLTSVTIPNSVTRMWDYAFAGCNGLTEIQSLATNPPSCGSAAFENVGKFECIVKVPEESIEAYKAANEWKDFWNIVALGNEGGGDNPGGEPEKCATPTIALQDGKIVVTTTTKDAKCSTSVTSTDIQSTEATEIELSGVYTITAYASKAGMWNSETATATLVWANPTIGGTGVMSMKMKKALLLRSNGYTITVDGLEEGEMLELYNVNGMMLDKVTCSGTSATLGNGLQKHQIYIIKAGDRS
ncbi:MAG: leucine-rich repeat domain-containing protein, partial [Bacteroidales bacterium]|nr:leucine-rich repeat domain-containing protein [Candidatus Physcousia equi]